MRDKMNEKPDMFESRCPECGKVFKAREEGKVRMAEAFCSVRCADKAFPEFAKRTPFRGYGGWSTPECGS